MKVFLLLGLLFPVLFVSAEETLSTNEKNSPIVREYPSLQMTELLLSNGMKVVLKKTDDNSEICAKFAALGGYVVDNTADRISNELAANVVIESGIGELCADKLSAFLYDHSIDFNLKIEPYTRSMDATFPKESMEAFFALIQQTFTAPHFTHEAFKTVLSKKKMVLVQKSEDENINDMLNLISVQEKQALYPLKLKDLEKADFDKSRQFFCDGFSNPEDFACVIAGDLDLEEAKDLALEYFSSLPKKKKENKYVVPKHTQIPKKIASKVQKIPYTQESLVRLGFPLQIKLDSFKLEQLELICQMIETRLRNHVKSPIYDAKGVDVGYETPLYPCLEHPWMIIQFHVDNHHIQPTIDLVSNELKKIVQNGFTLDEIKLAAKIKRQSLQLWEHDNDYWIILLSNHYLWKWDPENISNKFNNQLVMDSKEMHTTIKSALLINEYTLSGEMETRLEISR